MCKLPDIGSKWVHRNGNIYQVIGVANLEEREGHVTTIIYQNVKKGTVWARALSDWHRSMTEQAKNPEVAQIKTIWGNLKTLIQSSLNLRYVETRYTHADALESLESSFREFEGIAKKLETLIEKTLRD